MQSKHASLETYQTTLIGVITVHHYIGRIVQKFMYECEREGWD